MNHFSGLCGSSDSDSPHAIQQPSWDPQRASAGPEGSCQSHLFTWANMDCRLLYLGTSKGDSAVPVRWTQHTARWVFVCAEKYMQWFECLEGTYRTFKIWEQFAWNNGSKSHLSDGWNQILYTVDILRPFHKILNTTHWYKEYGLMYLSRCQL